MSAGFFSPPLAAGILYLLSERKSGSDPLKSEIYDEYANDKVVRRAVGVFDPGQGAAISPDGV